ncbi:MAG TPA: hypothetical protein VFI88_04955 [Sphingomicrobium sp.]|jgi:uncharacterized membrane protein HdeD (DUF308 family)|nr:hypothetical protein [Sphingomicrobium sp.]
MSTETRTAVIRVAGALILLLAIVSALLPLTTDIPARSAIGLLLIAAGAVEVAAVVARRGHHITAGIAAGATLLAGLRLELDSGVNFPTILNFVILWLVVRCAALFFSARHSPTPLCIWVYLAAAVDFALAVLLLGGLPVAVLVYGLFGTTNEVIATFAWIFAISFVAAGLLLIFAAPLEASEADQG